MTIAYFLDVRGPRPFSFTSRGSGQSEGLKTSFPTISRRVLPLYAAFFCAISSTRGEPLALKCGSEQVGKYRKVEFSLRVPYAYTNPFNPSEVDLRLRVSTPAGRTVEVPAFWCQPYERRRADGRDWIYPSGQPEWKARFAPQETGEYKVIAVLKDSHGTSETSGVGFRCVPSDSRGFLRVSVADPRFLEFSEGQPFFAIGQNLAFIGSQQYVTLSKAEQIFGRLSENGANYLRIWTCCEDWAMAIEARKSAFGRSWDWRPPVVPMPGAEESGRKCLKISAEKNTLRVEPSHPVALKPGTKYVLSAKTRIEPGVTLRADLGGNRFELASATAQPGEWREFKQQFETEAGQSWLAPLSLRSEGKGVAWVSDLSLREAGGGAELLWEADVNRPSKGCYNPLDSYMLDELLAAAERQGLYLQLCYLTRNLYMEALKDPAGVEYDAAIQAARDSLRYAVARWGYSTSVAAWEYWNEMDPGLPTDRFYSALGEYLKQIDANKHLRTTSTWGPSAKDCRHPQLDFADVHFYLRPADKERLEDEVDAVLERTRWLRQQAPGKPVHLGEFGLANEKWEPTQEMKTSREIVDFHNALWGSALSGASGTALFWWWDRLDPRDHYPHYKPLSDFLADVPWTGGKLKTASVVCTDARVRSVGLQTIDEAWIWLFNREAAWGQVVVAKRKPDPVSKPMLEIRNLPEGSYKIEWHDTMKGGILARQTIAGRDGLLRLTAPDFDRDAAIRILRVK